MINDNNKQSWCVNVDHAMSANNDGTTKICCMIRNRESMSVGTDTIVDNFNKPEFIKIREASQAGERHPACTLCWQEEDAGRKSKRLRDNEKYLGHLARGGEPFKGLAKFELNLGNTCNLRCRTCHPYSSSQWIKEQYDLFEFKYFKDYKAYADTQKKYHQTFDEDSPFWDDLANNLDTITQFDFYGGEPFLSKKMWSILELCVEKDVAKNIELHYATNGTQWPEDKIKVFKHFKHVNLNFSIDGVGKVFEYMRDPADWDEVVANMKKATELQKEHHDIHISWCITISALNIYDLPDVLEEHRNNWQHFGAYLNLVHFPNHFNMSVLPDEHRKVIVERLESIPKHHDVMWYHHIPGVINFIKNGTGDPRMGEEFRKRVKMHDEYRKQDFATTFPEYAKAIGFK